MEAGHLVSDEIILGVVRDELAKPEAAKGVIFDGVVRTIPQAEGMERILSEQGADDGRRAVLRRDRRGDPGAAGAPPRHASTAPTTIPRRWPPGFAAYREQTAPVLAWYEQRNGGRAAIPAVGTVEEIAARVRQAARPVA